MNKRSTSGWRLALKIQAFLNNKTTTLATVVGGPDAKASIDAKMLEIGELQKLREPTSEATTQDKSLQQTALLTECKGNAAIIIAYAAINKDSILQKETKKLMRKLSNSGASSLVLRAGLIYDTLQNNLASLAPWNVTAASQTDFKKNIDDFTTILSAPRLKIEERANLTQQIETKMKDLFVDFANLEDIIGSVFKTNPEFVAQFKASKTMVDASTNKRAAMCQVLNAETKAPIGNAKIITPFGTYISTAKGNVVMKSAGEGSWDVKVIKPGCQPKTEKLVIVSGETTRQIFYLEAA